jgi:hypothetical protein
MKCILKEQGLPHWKALNSLTEEGYARLAARFQREQPALAAFISTQLEALGEDEPLVEYAAMLAEIFWREARHALAMVGEAEIQQRWLDLNQFIAAYEAARAKGDSTAADIVRSCHQEHVLLGIMASFVSEEREDDAVPSMGIHLLLLMTDCLDAAAGEAAGPEVARTGWTVERVVEALSATSDPLLPEAIQAAAEFRETLLPVFRAELENWITGITQDDRLSSYAIYFLAQWRDAAAWPIFRQLVSLPGELALDLTGDILTQDGSVLLASVAGAERLSELQQLAENIQVNEDCRWSSLDALVCLVAWGEWSRTECIAYLCELLGGRLVDRAENDTLAAAVACLLVDLEVWEELPLIEAAFRRTYFNSDLINQQEVVESRAGRYGSPWENFCKSHGKITDVAEKTSWFSNEDDEFMDDLVDDLDDSAIFSEPPPYHSEVGKPYIAPPKVGRNDPCPCGSGKKYKKCCGK